MGLGLPILIVYNASAIGSIYGGYLPESFIRIGHSAQRARVAAMLVMTLLATLVVFLIANTVPGDPVLAQLGDQAAQDFDPLLARAARAKQGVTINQANVDRITGQGS